MFLTPTSRALRAIFSLFLHTSSGTRSRLLQSNSLHRLFSSANMSNEPRNLVVTALLLALLCNSVGGSRLMKLTASSSPSRTVVVNTVDSQQPPPPPPLNIQWPPPSHHHVRHHHSPPPAPTPAAAPTPTPTPPAIHNNVTSSPPPPPDQGTTTLNAKHSQPNGRRLFSSDERGADFGRNQFLLHTDHESSAGECAGGALAPGATHEAGIPSGGGGYGPVPEGAPVPGVVPAIPGPAPAPAPGISSGSEPALAPSVAGDNSSMAHSTMVSAMKVGLVGTCSIVSTPLPELYCKFLI